MSSACSSHFHIKHQIAQLVFCFTLSYLVWPKCMMGLCLKYWCVPHQNTVPPKWSNMWIEFEMSNREYKSKFNWRGMFVYFIFANYNNCTRWVTKCIIVVCNGDHRRLSQRRKALWSGRSKQCDVNYILRVFLLPSFCRLYSCFFSRFGFSFSVKHLVTNEV